MMQKSLFRKLRLGVFATILWLPGCGTKDVPNVPHGTDDAMLGEAIDDVVIPPAEYTKAALDLQFQLLEQRSLYMADARSTLYVNFDGAVVEKGYGLGQSFIVCGRSATIPVAGFSSAERQQILTSVQQYFDKAGAALIVTDIKPTSGAYTTIHVGGSYASLGCAERPGVLGVAPFDRGNMNPADVGFAFTARNRDPGLTAETIAHEAGHTYGLDHVDNRECLMYASNSSAIMGFGTGRVVGAARQQVAPAILQAALGAGSSTVVSNPVTAPVVPGLPNLPNTNAVANLPGLDQIAAIGGLIPELEPGQILDISALIPHLGTLLPGGQSAVPTLIDFDKLLTVVQLAAQAATNQAVQNGKSLPTNGSALAGILNPNTIAVAGGGLAAIAALSGQPGLAAAITILQPLISDIAANNTNLNNPSNNLPLGALPDLAAALSMPTQFVDPTVMVQSLHAHAGVINANFSGSSRQALLSMLKVAYSQAYLRGFSN